MEEFVLVGAEKDAVLTVPGEGREGNLGVATFHHGDIARVELFFVESPAVQEIVLAALTLVVMMATFTVPDELEGR